MTFQKYDKMKDSGIEWIGKIPDHWIENKIKYVTICLDGKRIPLNSIEREGKSGPYPYYGASGIVDYVDDFIFDEKLVCLSEDGENLVSRIQPISFLITGKTWVNNHAHVLKTIYEHPEYLSYFLNSIDTTPILEGATRSKLNQTMMNNIMFPTPPILEQKQITNYLDKKIQKIDNEISKNQKLIKLIHEEKQSTINNAVTKGLDNSVLMKDSRHIEVSNIPNTWKEIPLQYLASYEKNSFTDGPFGSNLKSNEYVSSGVMLIQLNNIGDGEFKFKNQTYITEEKFESLRKHNAIPGDVVISKMADPIARACLVPNYESKYFIVSDCIRLRTNHLVDNQFLVYSINCPYFRQRAMSFGGGSTRQRIQLTQLKKLFIILPPIQEQKKITYYLDEKMKKMNSLLFGVESQIKKLNEFKESLILSTVTGKICVSN